MMQKETQNQCPHSKPFPGFRACIIPYRNTVLMYTDFAQEYWNGLYDNVDSVYCLPYPPFFGSVLPEPFIDNRECTLGSPAALATQILG